MIGRALDSVIGVFSPLWALQRTQARATLSQIATLTGGSQGGYAAAKLNRLTKSQASVASSENAQPRADIQRLRAWSWDLYRTNAQARKICRTLESKVIGRGLRPQSLATAEDGSPNVEFRTKAHQLWSAMHTMLDYRGKPGNGGQDFTELCKTALRGVILGGEILNRFRVVPAQTGSTLPDTRLQLVSADRLYTPAEGVSENGNQLFYGIELDSEDRRVAYHVLKYHPSDPRSLAMAVQGVSRVPASDMTHLYVAEDIDQLRGVPWLCAALQKMRDTGEYEFTELTAAKVAACVVFGYRRATGQTQFGANAQDTGDLVDGDGNRITGVQPGMLIDLGKDGALDMQSPMRPNQGASEFIAHMLRSQATSVPGVKGSTLTGDFRNSSFSSERSADNDIWPELEGLQDWFSGSFCQPIYDRVVASAVLSGWFDGVVDREEFAARKDDYLRCSWQGPVARSINPVDDAAASRKRVENGQSTPQLEAALVGRNHLEVLQGIAAFIKEAKALNIPEGIIAQMLGIDQADNGPLFNAAGPNGEDLTSPFGKPAQTSS